MENKYYIPSVEEFHVGFEYEFKQFNTDFSDWLQTSFGTTDNFMIFDIQSNMLEKGLVRVKYLDENDVESFGFSKVPGTVNVFKYKTPYSTDGSKDAEYWYYWHIILFERSEKFPNVLISNYMDYDIQDVRFEGWVKNKSELKRLLIQLGIYEESN